MSTVNVELQSKIGRLETQLARLQTHLDNESMTRIQAQVALGSTEAQLALALDAARLATWQWNIGLKRISFNARWSEITHGVAMASDSSDNDWIAGVHPDDREQLQDTLMQVVKRKRNRFLAQFRYQTKVSKSEPWAWIEMIGVLQDADAPMGGALDTFVQKVASVQSHVLLIGCASDITLRKNHLDELSQARIQAEQASRSKTEFLAHISHELRTPLHAVLGMAQLLDDPSQAQLSADQTEHLGMLKQSAHHVLGLVNDLLEFASFERDHSGAAATPFQAVYSTVDLHEWIKSVCGPFKHRAVQQGITLTLAAPASRPSYIQLEHQRSTQILNNLLSNAFKFTHRGGIHLVFRLQNEALIITVKDTGIGIAPDKLNDIFNAFTQADSGIQRQYGGTGLGLAISRRICEHLGGKIDVQSVLNQGSSFTVTLPAPIVLAIPDNIGEPAYTKVYQKTNQKPNLSQQHRASPAVHQGLSIANLRILAVDDTPVNLQVIKAYLKQLGATPTLCDSAQSGTQLLHAQLFDVVIVDLQMPGMSGFEMLKLAKTDAAARNKHLFWIAATAHADQGCHEQCIAAGFDGFLAKPFSAEQLRDALQLVPTSSTSLQGAPLAKATPVFDARAFMNRFGFDAQLMGDICKALQDDSPRRIQELRQATSARDYHAIQRQAHALKGAYGQLGDSHIAQLCAALEAQPEQCTAQGLDALDEAIGFVLSAITSATQSLARAYPPQTLVRGAEHP